MGSLDCINVIKATLKNIGKRVTLSSKIYDMTKTKQIQQTRMHISWDIYDEICPEAGISYIDN